MPIDSVRVHNVKPDATQHAQTAISRRLWCNILQVLAETVAEVKKLQSLDLKLNQHLHAVKSSDDKRITRPWDVVHSYILEMKMCLVRQQNCYLSVTFFTKLSPQFRSYDYKWPMASAGPGEFEFWRCGRSSLYCARAFDFRDHYNVDTIVLRTYIFRNDIFLPLDS